MSIERDLEFYLRSYDEIKEYLKSGGDVTYAFLNLAKTDLEIASRYIRDEYCKKQVVKELRALEKALSFALLAYQWKHSSGGFSERLKLVGRAIREIIELAFIHFSGIL